MYHPLSAKNKRITVRSIKYKMYVLVLILFVLPTLVSSNANTPSSIQFIGYEETPKNPLYSKISRNQSITISNLISDITNSQDFRFNAYNSLGILPGQSEIEKALNDEILFNRDRPLNSIIPKPINPRFKGFLTYPEYNINVPLVFSRLQDLFETSSDGSLKRDSNNQFIPIVENKEELARGNYESVPVQRLLRDGVVHLAHSTQPGEIGNSYIVGHSSNFSSVQSPYNNVFKPIEKRSKVGEEFIIYDKDGRELKFKVFEVLEIQEDQTDIAYKDFGDRRVVTLQTSVLDANFQPTKRWLTRGELIIE